MAAERMDARGAPQSARRANPPMARGADGHPRCGRCAGRLFAEARGAGEAIVELGCIRCGARYYGRVSWSAGQE